MDSASREENASNQKDRRLVLIQSEPIWLQARDRNAFHNSVRVIKHQRGGISGVRGYRSVFGIVATSDEVDVRIR
jgi:hypothetical protein